MKMRITWCHWTENFTDIIIDGFKDFDNEIEAIEFRKKLIENPNIGVKISNIN